MNIRDQLKQASNKPVQVHIEGLGDTYIRRLTLAEADELKELAQAKDKRATNPYYLVARFLGDEANRVVFDINKPEDLEVLRSMPSQVGIDVIGAGHAANGPSEKKT